MMMDILGIKYNNLSMVQALESAKLLLEQERKSEIHFLNLDCLAKATKDKEYRDILAGTALVLPDGVGLRLATKMFGGTMIENCNGTDFSPVLMREASVQGRPIFFLGGQEGIAQKAADNVRKLIPGIQVVGAHSGYFNDDEKIVNLINDSGAQILFVAFGAPLQEKWIARNRHKLKPKVCLGVGALLDYLSGAKIRAPKIWQRLHLEWLWRVFIEPGRMGRRYIVDGIRFLIYLVVVAFKKRSSAK